MLRQSIDPEELYQGAMDAIAEGQWTIAQHLLIQLKTISPGNSDLEPLLAFVNNSIKASQEMSVENQKSIQSDDLETESIELPKDDEVILESDEIESLTDNEMISSEGEIEIHEESQIDEIEYVLPHGLIPPAIESETLDETQEDELEFVQPYEANQSAENIEGKLENQDEFAACRRQIERHHAAWREFGGRFGRSGRSPAPVFPCDFCDPGWRASRHAAPACWRARPVADGEFYGADHGQHGCSRPKPGNHRIGNPDQQYRGAIGGLGSSRR